MVRAIVSGAPPGAPERQHEAHRALRVSVWAFAAVPASAMQMSVTRLAGVQRAAFTMRVRREAVARDSYDSLRVETRETHALERASFALKLRPS